MKRLIAIAMLVALVGCASLNLGDDATSAEKRAAACADAQAAMAMADAVLSGGAIEGDALTYWTLFRAGAQIGMSAYCGASN